METAECPPAFTFANGPSSPPMTPGTRTHARFPEKDDHPSPGYKRVGIVHSAQSPPLEFIKPIGQGPQFQFTRPQSRGASSRPSTASVACATTPQDSEDEDASDEESVCDDARPVRRAEENDISFILEYLDSEPGYDSDLEVVRPDQFEDAKSERSGSRLVDSSIIDDIKEMHISGDSSDDEETRQRLNWKKKKRMSARVYRSKRTYSMSVEGDSSYSDNDPLDDVDESARRLRRRVDRSSLIFEDGGFPNINNITEVEEPEDGGIVIKKVQGPPSIPSDDAFTLDDALNDTIGFDELPFCNVQEWMEVESVYD
ncbi:hypothetical protein BU23DRAFT_104328 [Bimuria novae-zelandiae CBS 107.79]|uniref:Uncharacterized protein n=1 Tax=Bimuria novae-zelandiae CBS 107.79 TaxID=1447943 RepID=A0A6A5VVH2_9PLEO|nr:hypothetical protein BU23DRAFT_104328 [Bimuria novae-zelandiae CBS 107.79]